MNKNILILATVGGFLKKFETENVKLLQSLGYKVHYAANMREQHYLFEEAVLREMGVEAHHIDIERSPYMIRENKKAFAQLLDIIDTFQISIIHCHTPVGGVLGRLAGRYFQNRRLQIIYTAHGFHFYKGAPLLNNTVYYLVERLLARYTDVLITINQEDYDRAKKFRLKQGGRVYKISGVGLDRAFFSPLFEEEKKKNRRELGTQGKFFFVTAGELNENKNQRLVLEALEEMKERGKDISNYLYGICGDGFFYNRIKSWIEELGLNENVKLYGYQMDVRKVVGSADCFVFPSKREGLGMAALEALSMGIPVIASDNRGTREYMKHKKNGYVCPSLDTGSFIQGLEYIENLEETEKAEMCVWCRESVRRFSTDKTRSQMEAIYRGIEDGEKNIGHHRCVQSG